MLMKTSYLSALLVILFLFPHEEIYWYLISKISWEITRVGRITERNRVDVIHEKKNKCGTYHLIS